MNDLQQASATLLDRLTEGASVEGAALVSRDGIPILFRFRNAVRQETLSAMGAAILGAAETALADITRDRVSRIIVEAPQHRLVITGVDEELLLVALISTSAELEPSLENVQSATDRLRQLLVRG